MKRYLGFSVVLSCGALIGSILSGCVSPESAQPQPGERPSQIRPAPGVRGGGKTLAQALPITIIKAAATPTPSAKAKQKGGTKAKAVPTGTSVPYYFCIESGFWPTGVDQVNATIQCFEVTSINRNPAISMSSSALAVFGTAATSKAITLTPGSTCQVNMNFPTSTAGKTLALIITGEGEDSNYNVFNFSGANILVVNP